MSDHYDMHEDITWTYDHLVDVHMVIPRVPRRSCGQGPAGVLAEQHMGLHGDEPARPSVAEVPAPVGPVRVTVFDESGHRFFSGTLAETHAPWVFWHRVVPDGPIDLPPRYIVMRSPQGEPE